MKKINMVLGVLSLCVVLIAMGFYGFSKIIETPGIDYYPPMLICFLFSIAVSVGLALILTRYLLRVARQEQVVEMQDMHIQHLQEMMRVIRTQRHDFVNHLQTVYGLMQLGEVEEAQNLISDLYGEIKVSGEILRLGVPELTALLMVKIGVAASRNISVDVQVLTDLKRLKVRPLDIVAVLGNMLNNAIEAVDSFEKSHKKVELRIFEDSSSIVFETHNFGYIPEDIQARIFEAGFSTKVESENQGLGLASIRELAEKYRGRVSMVSHLEKGTTFTVSFPA